MGGWSHKTGFLSCVGHRGQQSAAAVARGAADKERDLVQETEARRLEHIKGGIPSGLATLFFFGQKKTICVFGKINRSGDTVDVLVRKC